MTRETTTARVGTAPVRDVLATVRPALLDFGMAAAAGIVIPRVLGPTSYGEYAFLAATFGLAASLADGGLGLLVIRHVGARWNLGSRVAALALFRAIHRCRWFSGLGFALAAAGFLLAADPFAPQVIQVALAAALVLTMSISTLLFHFQLAAGQPRVWAWIRPARTTGRLLLAPAAFVLAGMEGLLGALLLWECMLLTVGEALRRRTFASLRPPPDWNGLKNERRLITMSWLALAVGVSAVSLGPLMVGTITKAAVVTGYFALAIFLVRFVIQAPTVAYSALGPFFGTLDEEGDHERYDRGTSLALRLGAVFTVTAYYGFLTIGRELLQVVLGPGFEAAFPVIAIALLAAPAQLVSSFLQLAFNQRRRPGLGIPATTLGTITFVVLGIPGSLAAGALGTAAAFTAGATITAAGYWTRARESLEMKSPGLGRTIVAILPALLLWPIDQTMPRIGAAAGLGAAVVLWWLGSGAIKVSEIATLAHRIRQPGEPR